MKLDISLLKSLEKKTKTHNSDESDDRVKGVPALWEHLAKDSAEKVVKKVSSYTWEEDFRLFVDIEADDCVDKHLTALFQT